MVLIVQVQDVQEMYVIGQLVRDQHVEDMLLLLVERHIVEKEQEHLHHVIHIVIQAQDVEAV